MIGRRVLLPLALSTCLVPGAASAQDILLEADFNDKAIDEPIGTGGAEVGEPVSIGESITAIVRDVPFPTPCLELRKIPDISYASVAWFEFLGSVEITEGIVVLSADLWFAEYGHFVLYIREQGSASQSFCSVRFYHDGDIHANDCVGSLGNLGEYQLDQRYRIKFVYDMDAGTYDFYFDNQLQVDDRTHGCDYGYGVGSILVGCGHGNLGAEGWYVDNVFAGRFDPQPLAVCCAGADCYLTNEDECSFMGGEIFPDWETCEPNPCPPTPVMESSWGKLKALFKR